MCLYLEKESLQMFKPMGHERILPWITHCIPTAPHNCHNLGRQMQSMQRGAEAGVTAAGRGREGMCCCHQELEGAGVTFA